MMREFMQPISKKINNNTVFSGEAQSVLSHYVWSPMYSFLNVQLFYSVQAACMRAFKQDLE